MFHLTASGYYTYLPVEIFGELSNETFQAKFKPNCAEGCADGRTLNYKAGDNDNNGVRAAMS